MTLPLEGTVTHNHDPFTIRCGTLLDGVGGRFTDMAVSVAGGRIQSIAPWNQRRSGTATRLIDAGSLTVMPGLIECHDHLAATPRNLAANAATPPSLHVLRVAEAMRSTLQAGFTTARDMGGLDLGMKMAVESGELAGPRVLICLGILTQTSGLSDYTNAVGFNGDVLRLPGIPDAVCDGIDQVRAMTRRMIRGGADFIKIATTGGVSSRVSTITTREFSFDEVKAVVDEARAFNRPVAAHAYAGEGLKNALRAGVRTVEHIGPLDDDDIATIVRQGTYLVPTLSNMAVRLGMESELPPFSVQKAREVAPIQREAFVRILRAGVKIASGTDSRPFKQGGNALELSLLVQYGMSPMQAIMAATSVAADCCNVPDTGRLEVGRRADIIAVDADPVAEIELLQEVERIQVVMRDGVVFKNLVGVTRGA
jgi:imidazolonepropionase-like amidohydrolase